MVHITDSSLKPWAVFDAEKDKKYTNFNEVQDKIISLTDKEAGVNKGIIDKPIVMTVFSPVCPDLTIVDLPGITRIPLKGSD